MTPPKATNDSQTSIDARLSILENQKENDERRRHEERTRYRWTIGVLVGIGLSIIGTLITLHIRYADSYNEKLTAISATGTEGRKDLKDSLDRLIAIQLGQASDISGLRTDIAEIKKDISYQSEDRKVIDSLRMELNNIRIEVERLKKL